VTVKQDVKSVASRKQSDEDADLVLPLMQAELAKICIETDGVCFN